MLYYPKIISGVLIMKKMLKWLFFIPSIALFIIGLVMMMKNIWLTLVCFLAGSLLWGGFANRNKDSSNVQTKKNEVPLSIDELYEIFKDVDTPLGKPWKSSHGLQREALVYGPGVDKYYILVYKSGNRIYAMNDMATGGTMGIDEEGAKAHEICMLLADSAVFAENGKKNADMPDNLDSTSSPVNFKKTYTAMIQIMFDQYAATGIARWPAELING